MNDTNEMSDIDIVRQLEGLEPVAPPIAEPSFGEELRQLRLEVEATGDPELIARFEQTEKAYTDLKARDAHLEMSLRLLLGVPNGPADTFMHDALVIKP